MNQGHFLVALLSLGILLVGLASLYLKLHRRFRKLDRELARQAKLLGSVAALERDFRGLMRRMDRRISDEIVQAGYLNALSTLHPRFPVFFGGPALDGYTARALFERIESDRPKVIVEIGSGASTILIAALLERLGMHDTRHIAIDDSEHYLDVTRRNLARHDLSIRTEFWHCPLGSAEPGAPLWYSGVAERLEGAKVDLVLVDGPSAAENPTSRLPAMEILRPFLSERGVVILDDAARTGEGQVIDEWLRRFPEFRLRRSRRGKGYAEFSRPAAST